MDPLQQDMDIALTTSGETPIAGMHGGADQEPGQAKADLACLSLLLASGSRS